MKRTPLRRCTPLRRTEFVSKPKRRPGLAVARATAFARDGGCVGPRLGAPDPCSGELEFDHVADFKAMGAKGPDRADHGQTACVHHHKGRSGDGGWLTTKTARQKARERLDRMHPTRHADAGCTLNG